VIDNKATCEPDPHILALRFCSAAKSRITRELITGRWTLPQAAEAFRVLDEAHPLYNWDRFYADFAGDSDKERHCREVILCAVNELGLITPEAAQAKQRLETELQRLLKSRFRLAEF
jgi:hypothetical protein